MQPRPAGCQLPQEPARCRLRSESLHEGFAEKKSVLGRPPFAAPAWGLGGSERLGEATSPREAAWPAPCTSDARNPGGRTGSAAPEGEAVVPPGDKALRSPRPRRKRCSGPPALRAERAPRRPACDRGDSGPLSSGSGHGVYLPSDWVIQLSFAASQTKRIR